MFGPLTTVTSGSVDLPADFLSVLRRMTKEHETKLDDLATGGLSSMQKLPVRTTLHLMEDEGGMVVSRLAQERGLVLLNDSGLFAVLKECRQRLGAPTQDEMLAEYPPPKRKRNSWVAKTAKSESLALFMEAALEAGGAILDDSDDDTSQPDSTEWTATNSGSANASGASSLDYS